MVALVEVFVGFLIKEVLRIFELILSLSSSSFSSLFTKFVKMAYLPAGRADKLMQLDIRECLCW